VSTQDHPFSRFASTISLVAGHPIAFGLALALILGWVVVGPLVGYSQLWLLAINTLTTIVTFLMVFVLQNSHNRYSAAVQIKLNEIIRAIEGARNSLIDAEHGSQDDLDLHLDKFKRIATKARDGSK
jgi:low affinity Fe/Cu permease